MATTNNAGNINPILNRKMIDIPAKPVIAKKANNNQTPAAGDKIEISRNAAQISKAVSNINTIPEIRINAVNTAVTQRVINQQRIPAAVLAAKMLLEEQ